MMETDVYSTQTRAPQKDACRWEVPALMKSTGLMASQSAHIAVSLAVIQR
jgi:hypothetical protein